MNFSTLRLSHRNIPFHTKAFSSRNLLKFLTGLSLLIMIFSSNAAWSQSAGFNSSYPVFSKNGGADIYYCMPSNTSCGANATLDGANLGSFSGTNTLVLKGAEVNNFKCGTADITAVNMNYRIYKTGSTPGSFIASSIPFLSTAGNGCSGQDQQWKSLTKNINVLSGLVPGNYTIEFYLDEPTNIGTQFLSNSGNNYKATFTVNSVFNDDFNRATLSPGGFPTMTYTSTVITNITATTTSNYLKIGSGATAPAGGLAYVTGSTSSFSSPYATTLANNPGLITWTFNFRWNRSTSDPAKPTSGSYGSAIILAGSSATVSNTGSGYAIIYGNSGTPDPIRLVAYSSGVVGTLTDICTSGALDIANTNNYASVRVTYNPSTNAWSLFVRDDGATAWVDPSSGVTSQKGITTSNSTSTGIPLTTFGFFHSFATGTNTSSDFDNFNVQVATDPLLSTNGTTTLSFANTDAGVQTASQQFNLSGTNLTGFPNNITINAPNTDFQVSSDGTSWGSTATKAYTSATLASTPVFVRFTPQTAGAKSGNITFSGGGVVTPPTVALTGTGTLAAPVTSAATTITSTSFFANWATVTAASAGYLLDVSTSSTFGTPSPATLTENFTTFPGGVTSFNGWTLSSTIGNYTTAASSGPSGPNSVKFQTNADQATSPVLSGPATQLSFSLIRNAAVGSFLVEGFNGTSWVTIQTLTTFVNTPGQIYTYNSGTSPALPSNITQFRFTYSQTSGNLAFDDVNINYTGLTPSFLPGYNPKSVPGQATTTSQVTGLTANTTYYYRLRATDGTNVSPNSGTITVQTCNPVGTPTTPTPSASTICQGSSPTTYTTSAANATSYNWSVTGAGNTIAGTGTTGTVTWAAGFTGSATVSVTANGCDGPSAAASTTVTVTPTVGTPTTPTPSASTICQASSPTTYTTSATDATSYNWSVTGAGNTISGTGTTGTVTWAAGFSGSATVSVTANGCGGISAPASTTVTVTPTVGIPGAVTPAATTICQASAPTAYSTPGATDATSYNWSVTGAGNTIAGTGTTGTVTWAAGFSGTATVSVTANGCNGPSTAASTPVTVTPTVGTPTTPTPSATTICQASSPTTYTTSATDATSYNWSVTGAGNTIAGTGATGTVTWDPTFTGTATISVTANGCNGPSAAASTTVSVTATVGTPAAVTPAATTICQASSPTTYTTAGATDATSYNWSVTGAGNTIAGTGTTGTVTWDPAFTGTATISVTANGCNGPSTAASTTVDVTATVGTPGAVTPAATTICQASSPTTYTTAGATDATSYNWSVTGAGNTIAGTGTTGTVTWDPAFTGTATVSVTANGCNGPSAAASTTVDVTATVGTPTTPTPSATTICQASSPTTYTTSATDATSYNWSVTGAGNTIAGTGTTGTVTWDPAFTGTATVSVTANGCNGPSASASTTVDVTATVGTPGAVTPAATTICQASSPTTYTTAGATDATSYNWSVTGAGNTIAGTGTTGTVTWDPAFTGTATISVTANGCNGPSAAASTTVNVTATVGTPGAVTPAATTICQASAPTTYTTAGATDATSYNWSVTGAGNTIAGTGTTGIVTWDPAFAGTATVSVTANGCNGPSAAASTTVTVSAAVGTPTTPTPSATTICQASSPTTYTTSATDATSYNWSVTGAGNTIAGTGTTGTVTWDPAFTGTATISVTANGCNGPSAAASTTVDVTATVGTPTTPTPSATTICQASSPTTYTTSATDATSYNWSVTGAGNTIAGTGTTGTVTWDPAFTGTATISVTANGCNGPSASASTTVDVTATVGTPGAITPAATIICQASSPTTYTTSGATDATSYNWSVTGTGNTIAGTGTTGTVTWDPSFTGTATVSVTANGCNGPSAAASTTVTVSVAVGTPTTPTPSATTICQASSPTTYTTSATDATSYNWSVTGAGNTIAGTGTTGTVTWAAGFTGVATVSVTANGCNGPSAAASTTVTVTATVGTPGAVTPAATTICQASAPTTYTTAGATDATSYNWSVTGAGNTIAGPGTTGTVTWAAGFTGVATVSVTANGCNGPSASASTTVTVTATVGTPTTPTPSATTICQGSSPTTYTTSATNATSYSWSVTGAGNTIAGTGTTGTVTWAAGFTGVATVSVTANGCNGPSAAASTTVTVSPSTIPAPTVTGPTNVCPYIGTGDPVTYTFSSAGATGYTYILPPNVGTVSSTANSVTVTFPNGFASQANKQIKVTATSACGNSPQTIYYLLTQAPNTPGPITGNTNVCGVIGTPGTITYSVAQVPGATSYVWTAQTGNTTITYPNGNGVNGNTVNVSFGPGFTSSSISVVAVNGCGTSGGRGLALVKTNPQQPGLISGSTNVCENMLPGGSPGTYSIVAVTGATSYNWNVTGGASIVSHPNGAGPNDIQVTVSFPSNYTSGTITVSATNGCGTSSVRSLSLTKLSPATPGIPDVIQLQDCPSRQYSYTIAAAPANATLITWTVPTGQGASILSMSPPGPLPTSIIVSYPGTAINGAVTVQSSNNCGVSNIRSTTVKLPACPEARPMAKGGTVTTPSETMQVNVFPNPSVTDFKLQVLTAGKDVIHVRILDMQGREYKNITVNAYQTTTIGSDLKAGAYMMEVRQGDKLKTTKLLKF